MISIWLQIWVWNSNSLFKNSRLFLRRQIGRSPKLITQLPLTQILRLYHSLPPIPNMFYNSHLYVSFLQELFLMSERSRIGLGRSGCTLKRNTNPCMLFQSVPVTRQNANQLVGNRFESRFGTDLCADNVSRRTPKLTRYSNCSGTGMGCFTSHHCNIQYTISKT